MKRRTALAGVATLALPFTGCIGGSEGPGGEETNTTAGEEETMNGTDEHTDGGGGTPAVHDTSLSALDSCPEVALNVDDDTVVCRGCVRGKNACTIAVLDEATYDADADELRVVVATEEDREEGTMCAQVIQELGYEVSVTFDGGLPGTVTLVEDDVDGQNEALSESL
ncbi:hypothetical protein [Halogeometricum borinquense]|uniref:hypothetical protein n=1 Tax=Halogeometricum borinquense TaxID=60847 RepID=UPI003415FAA3